MVRRSAFFALMLASGIALSSCGGLASADAPASGADAGAVESRLFTAVDFTAITAAGPDRVIIRRGDAFMVSARGRAGLLDRLTVRVDGTTLRLGREDGISYRDAERLGTAVITITLPRLTAMTLAGSGEMQAERMDGGAGALTLAGSGDLLVSDMVVDSLNVRLAGSGNMTIAGRARSADVSVAGSGDVSGITFGADTADVSVAGSGNVRMQVSGAADVSVVGSGDVTLTGGARCTTSRRGSGDVTCS